MAKKNNRLMMGLGAAAVGVGAYFLFFRDASAAGRGDVDSPRPPAGNDDGPPVSPPRPPAQKIPAPPFPSVDYNLAKGSLASRNANWLSATSTRTRKEACSHLGIANNQSPAEWAADKVFFQYYHNGPIPAPQNLGPGWENFISIWESLHKDAKELGLPDTKCRNL
jgi:hypothetical protein